MQRLRFALFFAILSLPMVAGAQPTQTILTVDASYPTLATGFQLDDADNTRNPHGTLSVPSVFPMNNGELGMFTGGGCRFSDNASPYPRCPGHNYYDPSTGTYKAYKDSLFFFKRQASGLWVDGRTGSTAMSAVQAATFPFYEPESTSGCVFNPDGSGVEACSSVAGYFGGPAVVSMGSHVFAVYSRGNSDGYAGELWWAYSTDNGANWQQYPTPVMYGKYHSRFGPLGRTHVTLGSEAEGFGGASMAFLYEQGVLYAYIYTLYISPSRENHAVTAYLALTYKIRIDLSTASGLTSDRYILLRNTWTPHDGAFVFSSWPGYSYSPDSTYEPGAPFIGDYDSSWNETTGNIFVPSSVTHNGSVFVMLLGTHFSGDNNTTPLRFRVSSNGVDWCGPAGLDAGFGNTTDKGVYQIDISALATDANAAGPHHRSPVVGETSFHNSMWYGTLSGTTSYWGFLTLSRWAEDPAVPDGGDPDDGDWYNGSRILPVKFRLASNATFPGGCGVLPH